MGGLFKSCMEFMNCIEYLRGSLGDEQQVLFFPFTSVSKQRRREDTISNK